MRAVRGPSPPVAAVVTASAPPRSIIAPTVIATTGIRSDDASADSLRADGRGRGGTL